MNMKTLNYFIVSLVLFFTLGAKANPCQQAESNLRDGDLVFFGLSSFVFKELAEATNTWTSHVGIVYQESSGVWIVAEGVVPVSRKIKFCDFISRGYKNYFEVYRLKSTFPENKKHELISEINKWMGKLYDPGFNFEGPRVFCSKIVYEVFKSTLGIEVGRRQTFSQLLKQNPNYDYSFWKAWFGGKIPWNRVTITPASVIQDEDLVEVYKSHPQRPF